MSNRANGIELPQKNIATQSNEKQRPTRIATAQIKFPLVEIQEGGAVQRGFHFALNGKQARKLKLLRISLHEAGVTYNDGRIDRHVDRAHDVFGWSLDQVIVTDA
jgi:hypothetical protein